MTIMKVYKEKTEAMRVDRLEKTEACLESKEPASMESPRQSMRRSVRKRRQ
jgi:hypothetical protein